MGITTVAKQYTIQTYRSAFFTTEQAQQRGVVATMVLLDFTYVLKYIRDLASGEDYMLNQFVPEFQVFFDRGCNMVILVFDTKSPINKYEEHQARYDSVIPVETPQTLADALNLVSPKSQNIMTTSLRQFVASTESKEILSGPLANRQYSGKRTLSEIAASETSSINCFTHDMIKRYESKDPAALLVMTDLVIPTKDMWKRVTCNNQLKKEILHYITCKLVNDPANSLIVHTSGVYKRPRQYATNILKLGYTPSPGTVLCIHGGMSQKPVRDAALVQPVRPDSSLLVITNEYDPALRTTNRQVIRADSDHPPEIINQLGEGELAVMYYSLFHLDKDQLVVSADGDMMLIALLASKYRIDSITLDFINKVHVCLKVPPTKNGQGNTFPLGPLDTKGNPTIANSQSGNLFVDINLLYSNILFEGPFRKCKDPISTYVAAMSLMGNDYIKGFCRGLTSGKDTVHNIPWIIMPFINNPEAYKTMITSQLLNNLPWMGRPHVEIDNTVRHSVFSSEASRETGSLNLDQTLLKNSLAQTVSQYSIHIDEQLFKQYTEECYYHKYKDVKAVSSAAQKKLTALPRSEDPIPIYVDCIRTHLSKSINNAMMSANEITSFARRLKWLLTYWLVSYVKECTYPNPCETYQNQSYYGWIRSPDQPHGCVRTATVSPQKPTDWIKLEEHCDGSRAIQETVVPGNISPASNTTTTSTTITTITTAATTTTLSTDLFADITDLMDVERVPISPPNNDNSDQDCADIIRGASNNNVVQLSTPTAFNNTAPSVSQSLHLTQASSEPSIPTIPIIKIVTDVVEILSAHKSSTSVAETTASNRAILDMLGISPDLPDTPLHVSTPPVVNIDTVTLTSEPPTPTYAANNKPANNTTNAIVSKLDVDTSLRTTPHGAFRTRSAQLVKKPSAREHRDKSAKELTQSVKTTDPSPNQTSNKRRKTSHPKTENKKAKVVQ